LPQLCRLSPANVPRCSSIAEKLCQGAMDVGIQSIGVQLARAVRHPWRNQRAAAKNQRVYIEVKNVPSENCSVDASLVYAGDFRLEKVGLQNDRAYSPGWTVPLVELRSARRRRRACPRHRVSGDWPRLAISMVRDPGARWQWRKQTTLAWTSSGRVSCRGATR